MKESFSDSDPMPSKVMGSFQDYGPSERIEAFYIGNDCRDFNMGAVLLAAFEIIMGRASANGTENKEGISPICHTQPTANIFQELNQNRTDITEPTTAFTSDLGSAKMVA